MIKLLLIEDDKLLSDSVAEILSEVGEVTPVYNGDEGYYEVMENDYDALILDVMLPGLNGYQILEKIREQGKTMPVLMLTAKDSLEDKIKGFQEGADDYLTKPFHREELLLRVMAMLKRSLNLVGDNQLLLGNTTVALNAHQVEVEGQSIELNGKEFDLLVYLMQQKNRILTKEQIFQRIWGFDSETSYSVVEVYMSHLRKKLSKANSNLLINTIRNVGYILAVKDHD
ncbi:response regulator transcription factor [Vagococcus xieshaowenii]|uniref:Response regulator transcription factor n=1 Tax=Vagococcus xieshaowenii TaxID=2562451 RepID=A0A4Z0DCZ1_9ENTE|nr:response regulator transcription factor [Vagococcus xieshaowenii]QCA28463.1 response regulator transcription factor [Vagococcus xieshaowenii]TFZ42782.1 response regulator transcription factor [Vagococcus xieshaowenii]